MTRATEIKIEPDKHRLMHINASTLYKRRCQHRPATDKECTTHTTSHLYTSASSSRHTHTQTRTHTDATSHMHKFRIKHNIFFTHTHTHTRTTTDKVKQSLTNSHTNMYEHRHTSSHPHRLAAPVNRLVLVYCDLAGCEVTGKRQLHSVCRQTTITSGSSQPREAEGIRS